MLKIICSEDEVLIKLRSVSTGKAVGSNKVNNIIIKELTNQFVSFLSLYNLETYRKIGDWLMCIQLIRKTIKL